MDENEFLAKRFEEHRSHLRAVAYRMLGSLSEADDAVQEAWLRLSRSETSGVENLGGWLTTVVGRVCLDMLRSRTSRRVMHLGEPLGTRVPEPLVSRADGIDPEHEALLADSVGLALLVVLQMLSPAERLAFVLHDMFSMSFQEIAPIVGRSPTAARQLASRARRRVQGEAHVPDADLATQREVVDAFLAASRGGRVGARNKRHFLQRTPSPLPQFGRDPGCGLKPRERAPGQADGVVELVVADLAHVPPRTSMALAAPSEKWKTVHPVGPSSYSATPP